jgi:hypothetical protein
MPTVVPGQVAGTRARHGRGSHPERIRQGRCVAPEQAGYSPAMLPDSLDPHEFPPGAVWRDAA